jgi:anion-transporting  ArsA/GET3 family ATPase
MQGLTEFFQRHPEVEIAIFAGKGGLGKTTCSASLAYHMATIGQRKTLLFSTDPQASLSDILERDIYGKGLVEVLPNLTVVEIDADKRVTDYQNEIKQEIKDMYGMDEIPAEIEEYIDSTSAEPAMYESATYDAMPELVASLNPVHSLTSVFGQDLPGGVVKPVQDASGLYAVEVDTRDAVERYRDNIGKRVREFLKWSDVPVDPKPFINIAATNPAFEESAMFDKMVDFMLREGQEYDMVVFDTAAVANAVRLIGLSKIYGLWLARSDLVARRCMPPRCLLARPGAILSWGGIQRRIIWGSSPGEGGHTSGSASWRPYSTAISWGVRSASNSSRKRGRRPI